MTKIIQLSLILMFLVACSSVDQSSTTEKTALQLYSITPLNESDGYSVNSTTSDSISPIINSFGDTVVTGKQISITAKKVKAQAIENRTYRELGVPDIVPFKPVIESKIVSNIDEKIINRNTINEIKLGSGIQTTPLKKSLGKTIITGRKIKVKPQIKQAINRPATAVERPKFKENTPLNIRYLGIDQGLSSSLIYSIVEDKLGRLYFGSYGNGLMIYDGNSVQSFTTGEGLSSNLIRNLFSDSKGNIWIGLEEGGLTKYDGKTFTNYTFDEGFLADNVYDIIEDKSGNIWCATNNGVSKFDGKHFTYFTQKEGISDRITWCICEDSKGRIWIGNDNGVVSCFNGNKFIEYGEEQGIKRGSILSIFEDSEANIWISSMNYGVYRISGNTISHFSTNQGMVGQVITSISEDNNHNLWFTSFGQGVIKYDGKSFTNYTEQLGLSSSNIWMMHADKVGNLWLGSEGSGVSIIRENSFEHMSKQNGLKASMIFAMDTGNTDEFWLSNLRHGIARMTKRSLEYYSTEQNLSSNDILSMHTDAKENLWLGSWGNGVDQIASGQITNFNSDNGLGSDYIFSITEEKTGDIWFSTASGGAVKFDGEYFHHLSEEQGLGKKNVRSVFQDSKGNNWIATDGAGLVKFDGKTIIHYTEKEGLCSNYVRCIEEDKFGNIWVGTNLGGISIFTGKEFIQIGAKHGLASNNVRTINKTKDNLFIVGTEKGLNLIQLTFDNEKNINIELAIYGKQEGLSGVGFLLNTSRIDNENRIWWATGTTLTSANISDLSISKGAPKSLISRLEINQNTYDFASVNDSLNYKVAESFRNIPRDAVFDHSQNHLTFYFSGIDWQSPNQVHYSYRLNGENWNQASKETKADYRNLAEGKYTFEVRSIGSNYKWSTPDEIKFEILPPWWKTWWAYLMYIILLAACTIGIYRYQLKRQLAINEADRLREMNRLKTDFFTNISHEFRTPLTIITGLKERLTNNYKDRKDGAFNKNVDVLHRNSDQLLSLVNQLLDISKLEHGAIELRIETLNLDLLVRKELSSYASSADIKQLSLHVDCADPSLTLLADKKLFKSIFHNIAGNALKFTKEGSITVRVTEKSSTTVSISFVDTGIGIPPDEIAKIFNRFYQVDGSSTKKYEGTGIGLAHVKQLVDLHSASIEVRSELGKGTVFELIFPRGTDSPVFKTNTQKGDTLSLLENDESEEINSKPKLLIVEDNADMRYFISLILEDEYTVFTANDGLEGLKVAQELVPDFIISDWMMPQMTGPELLQELRRNIITSHIPVMLLTARADQESKIEGYKHGADAYLVKPFESEELKLRIKVLIDARDRLQAYYSDVKNIKIAPNSERPKIEDAFIIKTLEFIQEHMSDSELSGDKLAAQHHLSRSQFARKLKTLTNKSVTEFIREQRLIKAKDLLQEGSLNVSEVAYEVGFSDPAYFTRVFTKETGVSPTDWRDQN